ncbi:hypothetical protein [Nocardiopsis baichengensis]|uniref:hypothetical protein n=1 Tax=Nocardiopsis baichengensis TaxID=280240 RepID=UPI000A052AAA|nr:hypothetical protein [Nocardiopsis baichengensis]
MPADHRATRRPRRSRCPRRFPRPAAAAALVAVCLAAAPACGGTGSGPDTAELEARIAAEHAAQASASPEPAPSQMRFAPKAAACEPRAVTAVPGEWETSAPRRKVSEAPAAIGLRDASGGSDLTVRAEVTGPDGPAGTAEARADGDGWAELEFPGDFAASAPDTGPGKGTYTVVWSSADDGAFISCDGFRIT